MVHAARSGRAAVSAFVQQKSYRRRSLGQNFWTKAVTGVVSPIHDSIGLEGIASLSKGDIEYQESFEPHQLGDIVSAVRAFIWRIEPVIGASGWPHLFDSETASAGLTYRW
ncbi:hypothetical protein C442_14945 [Haloarcula amylolytica JCM 13557]|uniref:Uncharacterized protein n=1 Tax=Haloarcula amylolytica JCM 13557 TaxID=1227452 RepID=M0KD98_9EURY|nr:hypothetical protein C442_14945 [Haloarcula amylolytica JCM 13557]